jgi:hypothetical protein
VNIISEYTARFRSHLRSILTDTYSHDQLHDVVALAHAFALMLVRNKFSSGKVSFTIAHLDLHDIAYDCIAELFRRDDEEALVQFKTYFSGLEVDKLSDAQLVDHLRRLVFSKVEQGMFRIYAEHDASLAKILRNMKLAIHSVNNFVVIERFGEMYIIPSSVDPNFRLPVMPAEYLQQLMFETIAKNDRIPDILSKLSLRLTKESQFARAVPLVGTAIAVRIVLSEEVAMVVESRMAQVEIGDMETMIIRVLNRIKDKHRETYVKKNKLTPKEYELIFRVVHKNLTSIIIDNDGEDASLYDYLASEMQKLSKPLYRKRYKAVVEYILLLAKKELGKDLKRN